MAGVGAPQSTLTLQVAFASDPQRLEQGQAKYGPCLASARAAIGHLYGLSSTDVDALEVWYWDNEGHAHDVTEETLTSAMALASSCGARFRLEFVPGVAGGRAPAPAGKEEAAPRQRSLDVENGPQPGAEDGPQHCTEGLRPQEVATPPLESLAAAPQEGEAAVEGEKPEASKEDGGVAVEATAQEFHFHRPEAPDAAHHTIKDLTHQSLEATASKVKEGCPGTPSTTDGEFHFHRPEAPPDAAYEGGEHQAHQSLHEFELEARQEHRMDVTVFSPEVVHEVDPHAAEAEARATFRMD